MIQSFHPSEVWHARFISFSMINLLAEWYDTILTIFYCIHNTLTVPIASFGSFNRNIFFTSGHYYNLNLWKIILFILIEGSSSWLMDRYCRSQGGRGIGVTLVGRGGGSWPWPITLTHFQRRGGAALCDCVTRGHGAYKQKPGPGLIQSPAPIFFCKVSATSANPCSPSRRR